MLTRYIPILNKIKNFFQIFADKLPPRGVLQHGLRPRHRCAMALKCQGKGILLENMPVNHLGGGARGRHS